MFSDHTNYWTDFNANYSINVSKINVLNFKCTTGGICLDNKPITAPSSKNLLGFSRNNSLKIEHRICNVCGKVAKP